MTLGIAGNTLLHDKATKMGIPITFEPGAEIRLKDIPTRPESDQYDKTSAKERIADNVSRLYELGHRLYAENRRALLIVLQGMDTAGKDGTIRHIMSGVNPQCCHITSFKQPSHVELDHDFLWRIHRAVPRRGEIGIFNRSQYEDVVAVRVLNLVPPEEWQARFERINEFERLIADGNVSILKFFLHVGKEEQRERLQARLDEPKKRWKFSHGDLQTRKLWDDYQQAYSDALTRCNTSHAPWHVIPADRKWLRNVLVSDVVLETMERLDPQFPPCEEGLDDVVIE